jgi:hypothetical protein
VFRPIDRYVQKEASRLRLSVQIVQLVQAVQYVEGFELFEPSERRRNSEL